MKYNQMCLVTATGVCIAMLFTVMIRYLYQGGKITQLEWDVSTITAGDYTVEFMIDESSYKTWLEQKYKNRAGDDYSPALALKEEMITEIQKKMDDYRSANQSELNELKGKGTKKDSFSKTIVADMVFSFNNEKLIHLLSARGQKIANLDFDGMR